MPTQMVVDKLVSIRERMAGQMLEMAGRGPADDDAADRLAIYIDNNALLYRQMVIPIRKNLMTKRARGQYDSQKAVKAFMYLVDEGAKRFVKDEKTPRPWHDLFNIATRRVVAQQMVKEFETEAELGNYDKLLPKKYQREGLEEAASYKSAAELMPAIEKVIRKHMPHGYVAMGLKSSLKPGDGYIQINTRLEPDIAKLPNRIAQNDRAYQIFFIRGMDGEGTLSPQLLAELVTGGSLMIKPEPGSHMAFGRAKFGWRKKKGTPEQIVKHFDNYFSKVSKVVEANKDNMK